MEDMKNLSASAGYACSTLQHKMQLKVLGNLECRVKQSNKFCTFPAELNILVKTAKYLIH